jgi:hypothetical protein
VTETNAPSGTVWLRWAIVVLLILAGIVLVLILGPESKPVVNLDAVR